MGGSGRHAHRIARLRQDGAAAEAKAHPARDHGELLFLGRMGVAGRDMPAGREVKVESEQLAAGAMNVFRKLGRFRVRARAARKPFVQHLCAHLHAAQMIFQVMREDAEQLVLVLGHLLEPVARVFPGELRMDTRDEFRLVERLGDVIHAARLQRAHDEILVVRRREENDRDVAPLGIGLQAAADLAPVHFRHQ